MKNPSTILLGLGNDFITDDGAGIHVVREVGNRIRSRSEHDNVTCREVVAGGLALLDHLIGYDRCVVVDAMVTGKHPPGTITRFTLSWTDPPVPVSTSHQTDFSQLMRMIILLGIRGPSDITVFGIEAADVHTVGDQCTAEVRKAIPLLIDRVCRHLSHDGRRNSETAIDGVLITGETIPSGKTNKL